MGSLERAWCFLLAILLAAAVIIGLVIGDVWMGISGLVILFAIFSLICIVHDDFIPYLKKHMYDGRLIIKGMDIQREGTFPASFHIEVDAPIIMIRDGPGILAIINEGKVHNVSDDVRVEERDGKIFIKCYHKICEYDMLDQL
jgi:hypothetical protein